MLSVTYTVLGLQMNRSRGRLVISEMLNTHGSKSSTASGIAYAASKRRTAAVASAPADIEAYVREALQVASGMAMPLHEQRSTFGDFCC